MRTDRFAALLLVCLGLAIAEVATAATVSFTSIKDNSIFSETIPLQVPPVNSNGLGGSFHTGRSGTAASLRRGLILFDISAHVPPLATINSVQLKLTVTEVPTNATAPNLVPVSLHRLVSDWGEGTSDAGEDAGSGSGAPATTGDATWEYRFYNSSSWTTLGGDFVGAASASQSVAKSIGITPLWQSAGMIADVQTWLDDPSSNLGWIVIGNETADRTTRRFGSKDSADANLRPVLTIDFTPAPEPNSAVLALIGIAMGIGVRRRNRPQ